MKWLTELLARRRIAKRRRVVRHRDALQLFGAAYAWPLLLPKMTAAQQARWIDSSTQAYRVEIDERTGEVDVVSLGMRSFDTNLERKHASVKMLPEWLQERLAVLAIMKVEPPQHEIDGVGVRISENVFWVVADQEGRT